MDGWEGGVLAQLARLSAEYQGSGKACARTWREGAHVPVLKRRPPPPFVPFEKRKKYMFMG